MSEISRIFLFVTIIQYSGPICLTCVVRFFLNPTTQPPYLTQPPVLICQFWKSTGEQSLNQVLKVGRMGLRLTNPPPAKLTPKISFGLILMQFAVEVKKIE